MLAGPKESVMINVLRHAVQYKDSMTYTHNVEFSSMYIKKMSKKQGQLIFTQIVNLIPYN